MASDEEGNKGIKRKSQKSAEESANKHLRPDGASTSSETKQVEQGQGNVRDINWMKYCNTNDLGADPQCSICKEYHLFDIDPSTFKDHCKTKHPDIDTEGNESEWIFRHFDTVENTHHLKCRRCNESLEVLEFRGPFVEHFDDAHDKIAKRISQGDNEDAEEVKRRHTKKFVAYLYRAFVDKETIEVDHDARQKAWWMKYIGMFDKDAVVCGFDDCPLAKLPYQIRFHREDFSHIQTHYPEVKFERNADNLNYFSLDNYLIRCKRCNKLLIYYLFTNFVNHLKEIHEIRPPWEGDESSQETNNEMANFCIKKLLWYLIENYKEEKS